MDGAHPEKVQPHLCPPPAGSIFGASTSAKITDIFTRLKQRNVPVALKLRNLPVNLLDLGFRPSHAGNLYLAILSDPEDGRNVGQPVGARNLVSGSRVVNQHGITPPELLQE